jgi:hypothetical protein
MTESDDSEKTYRAIGRFIFEFSTVEFAIRFILAKELGLDFKQYRAVVESYDVAMLCTVAKNVFLQNRVGKIMPQ